VNRRQLLGWLGVSALPGPLPALAEQARTLAKIGYLSPTTRDSEINRAFLDELSRLGYAEGRNLTVLFDGFANIPNALPALANALVSAHVDLIVADGPEAVLKAVRAASNTIPTVMIAVNYDPIKRGYRASLSDPDSNVTGVYLQSVDAVTTQVELLKTTVPKAALLTVLFDAETETEFSIAESSAKKQELEVHPVKLGGPPFDFNTVFQRVAQEAPSSIVLVLPAPSLAAYRSELATATLRHRLPAMFGFRTNSEAGGLMSFGVNNPALRRRAAGYVAKVLSGVKPASLSIERANTFELVINLVTAKALGLTIPPVVLARANAVIK
jgi:putative ABC transport system substrate-binding protein